MNRKPRTSTKTARTPRKAPKTLWIKNSTWKAIGTFLTSRSRDIALLAIVIGAFVAVFDGSLYSATTFSFHGWSAKAFAIMPDALMVLSAAKMRQVGITKAQWLTAHRWMKIALGFSLVTNMIAAFLRNCPAQWITGFVLLAGAVAYHGMIVVFLKGAVDVLTKTREDRKMNAAKASEAPATVPATMTEVSAPVAPVAEPRVPVWTKRFRWSDTALAGLIGAKQPA